MGSIISKLSVSQLERAVAIRQQIERLEAELEAIASGVAKPVHSRQHAKPQAGEPLSARKKRTMSPEARARIAAAQKARWAKMKGK